MAARAYTQQEVDDFIAGINPALPDDIKLKQKQHFQSLLAKPIVDRTIIGHLMLNKMSMNPLIVIPNDIRLVAECIKLLVPRGKRLLPDIVVCLLDSYANILIPGTTAEATWTEWATKYKLEKPTIHEFMLANPVVADPNTLEEKATRVLLIEECKFVLQKAAGRIVTTQIYRCRPLYTPPQGLSIPTWKIAGNAFLELGRPDLVNKIDTKILEDEKKALLQAAAAAPEVENGKKRTR